MEVVFFANNNLFAWVIRAMTKRKGQAWKEVPSHCAVILHSQVYEYTIGGWNFRQQNSGDKWQFPIAINESQYINALNFAENAKGRYDWDAVFGWAVNDHLPRGLTITDMFNKHFDCSRFVCATLLAAGIDLGLGDTCPSPNDVLLAIRALNNRSLENLQCL